MYNILKANIKKNINKQKLKNVNNKTIKEYEQQITQNSKQST